MSNTVTGRRQSDNSQECIAKKRQWRRHANENTPEQNASIVMRGVIETNYLRKYIVHGSKNQNGSKL